MKQLHAKVVFLGAGPGGTGPLFAAIKRGESRRFLDAGLRWLERGDAFGGGAIGNYRILSDTQADVLLECIPSDSSAPLGDLMATDEALEVMRYRGGPLPLKVAGAFLARAGLSARKLVDATPGSFVHNRFHVEEVHVTPDGFRVLGSEKGASVEVTSRAVVSALGGVSSRDEALDAPLPDGRTPRDLGLRCVVTTDELFRDGIESFLPQLPAHSSERPLRVAVLGGSHSAYATAVKLQNRVGRENLRIQILCRRLPKVFYPTLAEAHADGYTQATENDVCPVTKRVFRLAGLRLHARDLVRRIWGLGNAERENNVEIIHLTAREPGFAGAALAEADLVVLALGYRPRTVPFFREGKRLALLAETGAKMPLVDGSCRILDATRTPIPSAFALGLASGFVPHGSMGGEPSFDGQTNGLWLYQNDVGSRVLDQLLALIG